MNRIDELHRRRNAASRGRWESFAGHRRRVTQLLLAGRGSGNGRLCVLGAGNCNDLDLAELCSAFEEVHLVDLDEESLACGLAAQGRAESECVSVQGGIDVAGFHAAVGNWDPAHGPSDAEVEACLTRAVSHCLPQLPGPFEVVASACLLTQLVDSLAVAMGQEHPRFLEVLAAVRLRHLQLLCELTQPGGTVILISDFVSSGTYPALATTLPAALPAVAGQLIRQRNFFTGVNPAVLHAIFGRDPVIAALVHSVRVSPPWLWDFGPRTYAVCALVATRRREPSEDATGDSDPLA